jgi:predicted RNA-binding Zn-ribbon protein involved in translation (DUF1610 family)
MSNQHATELPKPYCAACGHDLTGATAANACPECGRPLVEVLTRATLGAGGRMGGRPTRRYTSKRRIFGMPLVAIAYGPDEKGKLGHAKGYFAFGDIATGVFAFGGFARGLVAFGGLSIGGVTFGGLSLGTFAAFGGAAVAWLGSAVGGMAIGLLANGGSAIGAIAQWQWDSGPRTQVGAFVQAFDLAFPDQRVRDALRRAAGASAACGDIECIASIGGVSWYSGLEAVGPRSEGA